jgi:hypothetical protein
MARAIHVYVPLIAHAPNSSSLSRRIFCGAWYASKRSTDVGQLLEDAGASNALPADYTLPDYYSDSAGNLAGAKLYGGAADFWIGTSPDYGTLGATVAAPPYTAGFRSVMCHNVWHNS